jgi:hypothetical protein
MTSSKTETIDIAKAQEYNVDEDIFKANWSGFW